MIDQSQQSIALRVCLEDVGTHNRAVLDFFFAKLGQHTFHCVDTQDEANVLIVDYDFPPARQRYESEYQSWNKPAIILSISEVSLDNAIWLAKPLTSKALLDAAASAQSLLTADDSVEVSNSGVTDSPHTIAPNIDLKPASLQRPTIKSGDAVEKLQLLVDEPNAEVASEPPPSDNVQTTSTESLDDVVPEVNGTEDDTEEDSDIGNDEQENSKEQEKRWQLLCGNLSDFDVSSNLIGLQSEEGFFLSSVKDAVRLARQCQQGVLLNFPKTKIYVLPEIHRVFCPVLIDTPEFLQLIEDCDSGGGGKMHILSTPEIHELNDLISGQSEALYDLESFVWSSTLLSAQGLLPRELDPKQVVGLKHWPSMTRVESFPYIMPIAAQWSAKAMSAFDVAKSLNIPQRYVFSFYNAANTLGLVETDPEKLIKKQPTTSTAKAPRGLFSRLLKRLVGG